ncbi:ATP-binding protein [Streptomyces sp. B3I7]|uniref:ATP-binding protein n=1 Tax=Streptomyces sp. B3I7 TaxID=3042269 RepID=UPI0027D7C56F|nr:ATP-binding protein [Streptomyces sp. B3I7]
MDPNTAGPEEYGHDGDGHQGRDSRDAQARAAGRRSPRDSLTADFGQHAPAPARTARIVAGEFLLTVNPVDGSEIENRPPQEHPGRPAKYTAARRSESERAARPPVPPGSALPDSGLLQRDQERDRLVGLLARGRSVRLVGAPGSGRTVLLDAVAVDCADLAPDGVVRLSGHRRTVDDLMGDLYHAVFDAPEYRPGRDELREALAEIGAVVLLDDLEFGGAALDELLDATPECAYLCAVTPDVPAPSAEAAFEDVALGGLDRAGCVELLERAVGRVLTEEESNWAGDLLFESEGLPLRFKQAGALLRQRDRLRLEAEAFDEYGVFEDAKAEAATVRDTVPESVTGDEEPLPPLAEAAAAAPLLASRLSRSARETLRFAVALDGEVPHLTHLPALVDDTHADAALAELAGCALVTPVGARYRLAAGVLAQLVAAGYDTDAEEHLLTAARHYAWWAGHPSVTPERVAAEADAVLAALTALVPLTTPVDENSEAAEDTAEPEAGEEPERPVAVRLARQAAPAFAAGLRWGAWERALRAGAEASRLAGEVADQAYFHHELGVLALCEGQLDRARAELETSVGLRGAVADRRGTVAGRRALALVDDRAGTAPGTALVLASDVVSAASSAGPAAGEPGTGGSAAWPPVGDTATLVSYRAAAALPPGSGAGAATGAAAGTGGRRRGGLRSAARGTRRNLVAAGAGALLVAALGTVVTLGATSDNNHNENAPSERVGVDPSIGQDSGDDSLGADKTKKDDAGGGVPAGHKSAAPSDPGPDGTYGTADDPSPTASSSPSATRSVSTTGKGHGGGDKGDGGGGKTSSGSTPSSKPPKSSTPAGSPTPSSTAPSSPESPSETASEDPGMTNSASASSSTTVTNSASQSGAGTGTPVA